MSINLKKAHGMTVSLMRETVFALPALTPFRKNAQMAGAKETAAAAEQLERE